MNPRTIGRGLSVAVIVAFGGPAGAQTTTMESVDAQGRFGGPTTYATVDAMTPDGRFIVFDSGCISYAPGVPGITVAHVYLRDRANGSVERVSLTSNGQAPNGDTWVADISDDGRVVVFQSSATNLVPGDTNGFYDIFARDRASGVTERLSVGPGGIEANHFCFSPAISGDGRYVVFTSGASNLVPGDQGLVSNVFLRDRQLGVTLLVDVNTAGGFSNGGGGNPRISPDGRFVVFQHSGTDLVAVDNNGVIDVFLRDRVAGTTELVSVSSAGVQANGDGWQATLSADARYIAWWSFASNLVPGDTNGSSDVFVRDRVTGTTMCASLDAFGAVGDNHSGDPVLSRDGRSVAFASRATNLVLPDLNGKLDVLFRNLQTGTLRRLSDGPFGAQGDGDSFGAINGADGRYVAFTSEAANLVLRDRDMGGDAFLVDTQLAVTPSAVYCTVKTNSAGCTPMISVTGAAHTGGAFDSFYVVAYYVLPGKPGVLLWSASPAAQPFGGGTLCVQSPLARAVVPPANTLPAFQNCTGTYSFQFRQPYMVTHGLTLGVTLYAQFLSRDQGFAAPNNIGLTDAVQFTLCN